MDAAGLHYHSIGPSILTLLVVPEFAELTMWTPKVLVLLLAWVTVTLAVSSDDQLEKDEIISIVNQKETTWKAGRNFAPSIKKSYVKHLLGMKKPPGGSKLPRLIDDGDSTIELPKSFDAREQWKDCISLQQVRDQGPCGSCWAVAAAAAFTDRLCIATSGTFNGHLSAEELLACCSECGDGCNGGYPEYAWMYFTSNGICTGGDFHSKEGCQPYTLPECEHHVPGKRKNCSAYGDVPTPACRKTCYNKKYKDHSFPEDHHKVKDSFGISLNNKQMQTELYKNGPLEAGFEVYEDFLSYKSGVYKYTAGSFLGRHAVKVIGWGEDNGTPYWLVANSWNSDWGDNGFFKIRRGNNECDFEQDICGGHANV